MLENDSGLAMTLSSCWSTREQINSDICLTVFLSKGHRFQFLDTNFTAFGLNENATTQLTLEPLTLGSHTFDPSLELIGGNVDTNSVWKEEHWFKYRTKVLRGLQMGMDFDLLPPRIAIDGEKVFLPRITVRTVQDKLCSIQQLM
jgi:hypothetical protein